MSTTIESQVQIPLSSKNDVVADNDWQDCEQTCIDGTLPDVFVAANADLSRRCYELLSNEDLYLYESPSECAQIESFSLLPYNLLQSGVLITAFERQTGQSIFSLKYDVNSSHGAFDFRVIFLDHSSDILVEVDEEITNMSDVQENSTIEAFRQTLLMALFIELSVPVSPLQEYSQNEMFEKIESVLMFTVDGMHNPKHLEKGLEESPLETVDQQSRLYRSRSQRMPKRNPDFSIRSNIGMHSISWRSEEIIDESDVLKFQQALDQVSPDLVGVMVKQSSLSGLELEIMEDDLVDLYVNDALAFYEYVGNRIVIRRSFIEMNSPDRIAATLTHELAHVVHPRAQKNSLRQYYLEMIDEQRLDYYPFVSPYARYTEYEFFAESVVAYLNGENDEYPIQELSRGPRAGSELRKKTPQMYESLELYLNSENDKYYGNPNVFAFEN